MKALDEHLLMVVFMLLLNRVYAFAIFMFNLNREMCTAMKQLNSISTHRNDISSLNEVQFSLRLFSNYRMW